MSGPRRDPGDYTEEEWLAIKFPPLPETAPEAIRVKTCTWEEALAEAGEGRRPKGPPPPKRTWRLAFDCELRATDREVQEVKDFLSRRGIHGHIQRGKD